MVVLNLLISQLNLLNNLITIFNCKSLQRFVQIGSSDEYGFNKSPQLEFRREDPKSLFISKSNKYAFINDVKKNRKFSSCYS